MKERFDLAIVGGGCSGLSLAVHLVEAGLGGRRLAVLESRPSYVRDRTWCGWSVRPHRFENQVSHRWSRWRVRNASEDVVHASDEFFYEHLPADAFYDECLRVLSDCPDVELRLSSPVLGIEGSGRDARIRTKGGPVFAERVVDTRLPAQRPGALLQHFAGWHVRTDRPVFDPEVATLMDFDVPQDLGLHFEYVLPFSENEALVEATFVSESVFPLDEYEARVRSYLANRFGARVEEVLWSERGAIPMDSDLVAASVDSRIVAAGTAAGTVKPSSGYGFLAIQRETEALARELLGRTMPRVRTPRGRLTAWLDSVFLRFLEQQPRRAPAAFAQLFRSVSAETLARFLMEEGRLRDHLEVVRAMPPLPLLRAALQP